MQVAVDANRTIHQHGSGLGPLENPPCTVEEVDDDTYAAILAALADAQWGVTLSEDHSVVTPAPEPDGYQELLASAARQQEAMEALKAHAVANPEDPTAILARALGLVT